MSHKQQSILIRSNSLMVGVQLFIAAAMSVVALIYLNSQKDAFLGALFGFVAFESLVLGLLATRRYVRIENSILTSQGLIKNQVVDLSSLISASALAGKSVTLILKDSSGQQAQVPLSFAKKDIQQLIDHLNPIIHGQKVQRDAYIDKILQKYKTS